MEKLKKTIKKRNEETRSLGPYRSYVGRAPGDLGLRGLSHLVVVAPRRTALGRVFQIVRLAHRDAVDGHVIGSRNW